MHKVVGAVVAGTAVVTILGAEVVTKHGAIVVAIDGVEVVNIVDAEVVTKHGALDVTIDGAVVVTIVDTEVVIIVDAEVVPTTGTPSLLQLSVLQHDKAAVVPWLVGAEHSVAQVLKEVCMPAAVTLTVFKELKF